MCPPPALIQHLMSTFAQKNEKETSDLAKVSFLFFSNPLKHSFTISANEVDMTTKDSIRSHSGRLSAALMETH